MKKYKSEIKKVLHLEAMSMHKVGGISDERMQEYDKMCLVKPAVSAARVSSQKPIGAVHSSSPVYAHGK